MLTSRLSMAVAAGFLALAAGAFAQESDDKDKHVAYVTVVTGGGATHIPKGDSFPARPGKFQPYPNGIFRDEGVKTAPDGEAIVMMPTNGIAIHLEPDSVLEFVDWPTMAAEVPVALLLRQGQAYVIRREGDDQWLLCGAESGEARAWTLSNNASMVVTADAEGQEVTFVLSDGQATYYPGAIPFGLSVDDAGAVPPGLFLDESGQLLERTGVPLSAGQRVSTQAPAEVVADALSGLTASEGMVENMYAFGLSHGQELIEDTEKGDFTPVRESGQAPAQAFGGRVPAAFTMAVPRFAMVVTPQTTGTAIRVSPVSPARKLLASGVPTESVVGVRFVRSRIIGIPGTGGPLIRVNPFVDIPIVLRR